MRLILLSIILVGQNLQSAGIRQAIDQTHTATLGDFEIPNQDLPGVALELVGLKAITREIYVLLVMSWWKAAE